jgi:hypothetical protein
MSDLIEFLRARLDEEAEVARAAMINSGGEWAQVDPVRAPCRVEDTTRGYVVVNDDGWTTSEQAAHIARHDPARVLAEVEAKRRIIALWKAADDDAAGERRYADSYDTGVSGWPMGREDAFSDALRLLAFPYANHPDYRAEWAPSEESNA